MSGVLRRPRPRTRPVKVGGVTRGRTQRICNGCARPLGDVTAAEIDAGSRGRPILDVRAECPECTPNPPGLEWILELPLTRPLSMNDRLHWRTKHLAKAQLRAEVRNLAAATSIPPLWALTAVLHYAPRDVRTRDPLNLAETLKVCEDALVDANLVPDDNPLYVTSAMPVIDEPTHGQGRLYLIVRELQPRPEGT